MPSPTQTSVTAPAAATTPEATPTLATSPDAARSSLQTKPGLNKTAAAASATTPADKSVIPDPSWLNLPPVSSNFSPSQCVPHGVRVSDTLTLDPQPSSAMTSPMAPIPTAATDGTRKTYAAATGPKPTRPADVPTHRFTALRPVKDGDSVRLVIPQELYQAQVKTFEFALIGRLLLRKGDKPRQVSELKMELQKLWDISDNWKIIPMGKGFFTFKFHSAQHRNAARRQSLWEISTGTLRIRAWTQNFNPFKEASSVAQIWVRVYNLPMEYWHPEILTGIGYALGQPIKIDGISALGDRGHFARILVEIDLSLPMLESLLLDGGNSAIYVEFSFEKMPLFCYRCKITGHSNDNCRKILHEEKAANNANARQPATKATASGHAHNKPPPQTVWQPTQLQAAPRGSPRKDSVVGSPCSRGNSAATGNRFDVLVIEESDLLHGKDVAAMTGPDILEAITKPVQESVFDKTLNEYSSEEEEETIIADDVGHVDVGDASTGVVTHYDFREPSSSVPGEIEGVVTEQQSVVEADGLASRQDNSSIKAVHGDKQSNPTPEDISTRINRLEEQVSQGMQLLTDQKRGRGRPKGSGKVKETVHAIPEGCIKGRLRNAEEMGYKPSEFVVDLTNRPSIQAMNNVVHGCWSDEMDDYPEFRY